MERSTVKKVGLLAAAAAISLFSAEGLLRRFVPTLSIHRFDQKQALLIETGSDAFRRALLPDPVLFWKFKPNVSITDREAFPFFQGKISNNLGLRNSIDLTLKKAPGTLRVLALGDSCTFGVGVDQPASWPARLEAHLQAAAAKGGNRPSSSLRIEVLDAGVPGYTSFQGLAYLDGQGLGMEPDLVIVCFGWNDRVVWDNRTDRFIARFIAGGTGTGVEGMLSRSYVYLAVRKAFYSLESTFHFGRRVPRVPVEEYIAHCRAMAETARDRGARTLFILWPKRDQAGPSARPLNEYQQALLRFCREKHLPLVDLRPLVSGQEGPSLYIDEGHMNAVGYDRVARAVYEAIRRHGLLPLRLD